MSRTVAGGYPRHVPVLDAADRLYALPLPEFTPARDALVREHRRSDRALSDELKALRKPAVAAWVVNLLVRRDPDQVDQVLAVGEALRDAQNDLDGDQLRALTKQRRQLTAAVTAQARRISSEHGQRVTPAVAEQVEATLTAAMVDAEVARAVRSGLLVRPVAATGVDQVDVAGCVALPEALGFTPAPVAAPDPVPEGSGPPDLRVVPDPDAAAKRRATAEAALDDAEAQVATGTEALREADARVSTHEARSLELQAEIDELRRRLGELEEAQNATDAELADARELASAARVELTRASSARDRAEQAVARLRD